MSPCKILLLLSTVAGAAYSQSPICYTSAAVVPTARAEGEAEQTGDIVLSCTGGTAGAATFIQVAVDLTINLTSRTFATTPVTSEALLLIDDPSPDAVDMSNGFPYNGQVLGKPGVAAGVTGSGNVYLGEPASATSVSWSGVPFVAPGPNAERTLRIANVRINAASVPIVSGPALVYATVTSTLPVNNPNPIVAIAAPGLIFSAAISAPSTATLTFAESFATAFQIRILNGPGGPFTSSRQDIPGEVYYSESHFTPCFDYGNCATPPSSAIGLANTGTLLLGRITGLGTAAAFLSVPNQVTSAPGTEVYLMAGGEPVTSPGNTSLPVTHGTIEFVYEVGVENASAIDSLPIAVTLLDSTGAPLSFPANTVFAGYLGPLNSTGTASQSAPEPRFVQ